MKLIELGDRPSAPPAACIVVAHESLVGRFAVWTQPAPSAAARVRMADAYKTSGPADRKIVGNGISAVNRQFTGDARGVPPRGRPV